MQKMKEDERVMDDFVERLNTVIQIVGGPKRFSVLTGYSLSSVNKWKTGESEPTREKLVVMAKVGGVTVGWLVAGDEDDASYGVERALKRIAVGGVLEKGDPEVFSHLTKVVNAYNMVGGKESVPVLIYPDIANMLEEKGPVDIMHAPSSENDGVLRAFTVKRHNKSHLFEGGDILVVDITVRTVEDYGMYILQVQESTSIEQVRTTKDGIETVGRIPPRSLSNGEFTVAGRIVGTYRSV